MEEIDDDCDPELYWCGSDEDCDPAIYYCDKEEEFEQDCDPESQWCGAKEDCDPELYFCEDEEYADEEDDDEEIDCGFNQPLLTYLNSEETRTALNIPTSTKAWEPCVSGDFNYTTLEEGSQAIWEELKGKYRMLKYSGDVDSVVATSGTLAWITSLNRTEVNSWRQWTLDDSTDVAGFVWELEDLTFVSVHGAGHMVPQDKRAEAHKMVYNWINQIDL